MLRDVLKEGREMKLKLAYDKYGAIIVERGEWSGEIVYRSEIDAYVYTDIKEAIAMDHLDEFIVDRYTGRLVYNRAIKEGGKGGKK